jgi:hypothetical protein
MDAVMPTNVRAVGETDHTSTHQHPQPLILHRAC